MGSENPDVIAYEVSARRDFRFWAMLLFGLVFAYGGLTIDPQTNCSEDGRECAPWLVPVAAVIGLGCVLSALAHFKANTSRGSRLNLTTGELVWWQNRTSGHAGDGGTVMARDIVRIRIDRGDENADTLHVYGADGERLAFLDEEVVGWRLDRWAEQVVGAFPHIQLEVRD